MKSKELQEISIDNIKEAAARYNPDNFSPRSLARNTVVEIDGKQFPVKAIGVIAYFLAYNKELSLDAFTTIEMSRYFASLKSDTIRIVRIDGPATAKYDFFEEAELTWFNELISTEGKYRRDDVISKENSEAIKELFGKSNYWAELVAKQLPGFAYQEDNVWQISGNFKEYAWPRLFLKADDQKKVFFTLGPESYEGGGLLLKLDCLRSTTKKLEDDIVRAFDVLKKEKNIEQCYIPAADLGEYDWDKLVKESVAFIEKNINNYEAALKIINAAPAYSLPPLNDIKTMQAGFPLNTILYGPPGTGKTYSTINITCDILGFKPADETDEAKLRDAKRAFFEERLGTQIEFITFHQSTSYENFIEGIKPETVGTQISYTTKAGVFTQIAYRALKNIYTYHEKPTAAISIDFPSVYAEFIKDVKERATADPYVFTTLSGSRLKYDSMSKDNTMVMFFEFTNSAKKAQPGLHPFKVRMNKIKLLYDSNIPGTIKRLNEEVRPIVLYNESVYYAVYRSFLDFIERKYPGYSIQETPENEGGALGVEAKQSDDYGQLLEQTSDLLDGVDKTKIKFDPYILIIDEINRGDVSNIFGELITLIENDKRFLQKEEIRLKLSYSGSQFSVPPNLYIIGTMNTADRSAEALDTALRRRFSFIEMPPFERHQNISTAIKIDGTDFNFQEILEVINRRLEKLAGRDHKIGHSYFMDADRTIDWAFYKSVFKRKIVPLLQEYFYGDYGKMALVLGLGFVQEKNNKIGYKFFAAAEYEGIEELIERKVWEIREIEGERDFASALRMLLNK